MYCDIPLFHGIVSQGALTITYSTDLSTELEVRIQGLKCLKDLRTAVVTLKCL